MPPDAADLILAARQDRRPLPPLGALAPVDEAAGYALQRTLAERLCVLPPAGFKIGATTRAMQTLLGLPGPVAGFMDSAHLHAGPATLAYDDVMFPGVECEIAVRLGADLPAGPCSRERAATAVAAVMAAIEVVERRYPADLAEFGTPTVIADRAFHAAGVLGAPVTAWQTLDLSALRGRIIVDGVQRGEGVGADLLGHPLDALAWLASSGAATAFGGLRAGQVILLGSVTPPIWLDGPATVLVDFAHLGEVTLRLT